MPGITTNIHNGPCKSKYSTEGNFIHMIETNSQFRTNDPDKAHVFFLPFSVAILVQFVYVRNSHDFTPIRKTVIGYVDVVSNKYPYWNRSLGADHFMLACHDWVRNCVFFQGRRLRFQYLIYTKTRFVFSATQIHRRDLTPPRMYRFRKSIYKRASSKDLLVGHHHPGGPSWLSLQEDFTGQCFEHWENKDNDIQVHRYLPKGVSYYEMMRKSRFCLCPSGYEVASPRVVEALYTGCVPVLISDHYVPPFSDVLNWKSFSVEVPPKDIPRLKEILTSISSRLYIRLQRRGVQIRKHSEVHSPPQRCDIFHMTLHFVWLGRLNRHIRDRYNS
ncbi:Exostosin, GT47 domain [Dillenia turbinata]|uniref:Exostosin, GT47 domain n=1 Tax=Dillenia turbinata TaxID=194707 RepID=A0AAN8WBA1_9MAGN